MSDKRASVAGGGGGVRNLRAMFENKDESSSPPDRGRSPAGSIGGGSNGASPRPLSKVRTSFVAVENKNGQWGLRRDNSGEPSLAKRRTSFSIDEEDHPVATKERKESIAGEFEARKNSSVIEETIPESAIETPSIEANKQLGDPMQKKEPLAKAIQKASISKPTEGESKKPVTANGATNGQVKPKEPTTKPAEKSSTRPTAVSTTKTTAAPKASPKKSPAAKPPKTPTPTSPGKSSAPAREPTKKASKTSLDSAATSKSSPARAPTKLKIQPSPPKTGFVKPKPRSPTRPVKLPASLTAHTASSGSKTTAASPPSRQTLSRASGNIQPANVARSPTRTNATKTLTRKPSTVNKTSSRPSLGPPPSNLKKQPSRQSVGHSAPADDSFLARMMRPTTSSEQKKAEKVPDTPPKRSQSVRRPATRTEHHGLPKMHELPKSSSAAPKAAKAAVPVKAKEAAPKKIAEAPKSVPIVIKKPKAEPAAAVEEPKVDKPELSEKADEKESAVEEPATEKPAVEEAKAEEPKVEEPKIEEPKVEEPETVETKIEEPKVEEPATPEPKVEDPKIEEPKSEEPKIEEPKIEEPKIEEPKTEEPKIEEPKIEEPKIEEPKVDEAKVEEPVTAPAEENIPEKVEPAIEKEEPDVSTEAEAVKETPAISEPESVNATEEAPIKAPKIEEPEAKSEAFEDPEDLRAREEIARLNAEIMGASPVSEVVKDQNEGLESY